MKKKLLLAVGLSSLSCISFQSLTTRGPLDVKIISRKGNYQLTVNKKSYFIKGAGGYSRYGLIREYGGNSVRLWSTDNAQEYLDNALKEGLTVTLGLDMGQERRGFDYGNKKAVAEQLEHLKAEVLKYKDHPALLMWGVGNEVDQFAQNYDVWNAVNDLAKFIHKVDPHHPTTTMLAGVPRKHIEEIVKRCPDLDILSINSFRDLPYIRKKITDAGWKGPYMIGEWGASGYWESDMVPWGTFVEETSTEKAEVCKQRYEQAIAANKDRCVGSYVFYWGYKQARTHTLLSLFFETGETTPVIDVLQKEWSGKDPANTAPHISPVGIDDKKIQQGVYLTPGSNHIAYTDATDRENDTLTYKWEILHESTEKKEGGDLEAKPLAILNSDGNNKRELSFAAPSEPGAYRLFVYVYDGHNHVATANAPFFVK